MGLFGERFDRKEKHVFVSQHQNATTGKQVQSRVAGKIKGEQLTKRKITQQNLYRKYRAQGMGILEAHRKAKGKASEIMLNQTLKKRHHHKKHRHKRK